ncbi:putative beta-N-hexosaminidase [Xylaria palmicola]|nr:putative beta-N-hexosaminidase [Xylaria palmicola]
MLMGLWLFLPGAIAASLQLLPPVPLASHNQTTVGFSLDAISRAVYITRSLASRRDTSGLSLIPPSGLEFARTFVQDLKESSGEKWSLEINDAPPPDATGIFLQELCGEAGQLTYEDGTPTEEGYVMEIGANRAVIHGSGSRGMFWGTRTLLQQLVLSNWTALPELNVTDAPAYGTRGYMLDAGRKWYAPAFLRELCTYASFFKMNEFHYHLSDNYPLNRGHNATWYEVYSQFSLRPESEELQGLVQRPNETLTRADFEDLQRHCATRGVTVIPEIEAPGHCLSITKWKPELALPKRDLLNLTHPDSVPTVKKIWEEFLPWFQTKEVHIGADEYDPLLADDYIAFVNELAGFIDATAGKRVRVWGTYEPSATLAIDPRVIIQHWQYGQSDPVALHAAGYELVNTEDWWAYVSLKNDHAPVLPAPYPTFFNETRVLNFGGREGWQWDPALFNPVNWTQQLSAGARGNRGAVLAAWNDDGPDALTQLETFYAVRRGIPLVAARAWGGRRGPRVDTGAVSEGIEFLAARAPGQNLDRRLRDSTHRGGRGGKLVSWTRKKGGGGKGEEAVKLGYGSKGMNYTLELEVAGPFTLESEDVTLTLDADGMLMFVADGWAYPLRSVDEEDGFDPGHPGRIWVNATSSTHDPITIHLPATIVITGDPIGGSRAWVDGVFAGRFEVFVFGGRNTVFSWSQMAFVAPLDEIRGGGIRELGLWEGVRPPPSRGGSGLPVGEST